MRYAGWEASGMRYRRYVVCGMGGMWYAGWEVCGIWVVRWGGRHVICWVQGVWYAGWEVCRLVCGFLIGGYAGLDVCRRYMVYGVRGMW